MIYGPEGCGKTALLLCAEKVFEEEGYEVVMLRPLESPVAERLRVSEGVKRVAGALLERLAGVDAAGLVEAVSELVAYSLRRLRGARLAVILDDVFQAVGLERVEGLAKSLLELLEYPPGEYERMVVLMASSEGLSRWRLARHNWVLTYAMWNLSRRGFQRLYEQLPERGLDAEEAWLVTGGNGRILRMLYELDWSMECLVQFVTESRMLERLVTSLKPRGPGGPSRLRRRPG